MAECLEQEGWDVEVGSDGSFGPANGIPTSQAGQYSEAVDACAEPLSSEIPTLDELTPQQWADLYRQESGTAECLRSEGIEVPEIPSEAVFVDQYQGTDPWTSYGFIGDLDESTWNKINATCPQPYIQ